jgi:hypothetical protein
MMQTIIVIILAGQSNMEGGYPLNSWITRHPDILYYHGGNQHKTHGPEVSLSHALKNKYPNKKFAFIKYAQRGRDLEFDWNPRLTGNIWEKLVRHVNESIAHLSKTYAPKISAMLWLQGEGDAKYEYMAKRYGDNLKALIEASRSEFSSRLPFIVAAISNKNKSKFTDLVISGQIKARDKRVEVFETSDLTYMGSSVHYDARSQIEIGKRFFNEVSKYIE